MFPRLPDRLLLYTAGAHLLVGLIALVLVTVSAAPVLGVHPALKPFKFGISIALFLASIAFVLPLLSVSAVVQRALAWALAITMILEMLPITLQAARGTTSHFNIHGRFNGLMWNLMAAAIVVATLAMLVIAVVATVRPLISDAGQPVDAISSTSWRVALWLFMLAAFSGFRMASQMRHSVGGIDGGAGLPVVNWSLNHGDLRVTHFISLHALQTLPLIGVLLLRVPVGALPRWVVLVAVIIGHLALIGWTLVRLSISHKSRLDRAWRRARQRRPRPESWRAR